MPNFTPGATLESIKNERGNTFELSETRDNIHHCVLSVGSGWSESTHRIIPKEDLKYVFIVIGRYLRKNGIDLDGI
jgi:hypothetical protein